MSTAKKNVSYSLGMVSEEKLKEMKDKQKKKKELHFKIYSMFLDLKEHIAVYSENESENEVSKHEIFSLAFELNELLKEEYEICDSFETLGVMPMALNVQEILEKAGLLAAYYRWKKNKKE